MLLRVTALGVVTLAVPQVSAAHWDDWCQVRAPRDASVPAAGAQTVRVVARAGSLRLAGEPGLDRVIVQGKACAHDQQRLDEVQLKTERSGNEIRVVVEIPQRDWHDNHGGGMLDLDIRVPASLAADVTDASGDATVSGVASVRIDDASGGLRIRDIAGEVRVIDRSGELEIERVGNVLVEEDGSGSIRVVEVKNGVEVRKDGSGEIDVRDVGGSVRIGKGGSGGIEVDNVRGDFTVDRIGSGGIHHSRVTGRVDVPEDRHARRARERAEREREREREQVERDRERAERDRERARERAHELRERELERAERDRERAREHAERARERARELAERERERARELAERYRYR
jgi:hypothetical protein